MDYRKKVGIMGGTFNPIHLGHMLVAETAYETFDLDEILYVIISDCPALGMKKKASLLPLTATVIALRWRQTVLAVCSAFCAAQPSRT